jgi:hypothetical protein
VVVGVPASALTSIGGQLVVGLSTGLIGIDVNP